MSISTSSLPISPSMHGQDDSSVVRAAIRRANRVVIKAGTSVITGSDGLPSLTRIGSITEQVSMLVNMGKEVIIVSSGAVGMGRKLLKKQMLMTSSLKDHVSGAAPTLSRPTLSSGNAKNYDSACAAAGQFGLMNVYNMMFDQRDMNASQLLLTQHDFTDPLRIKNLGYCIDNLLALGVIPIINENDAAVYANEGYSGASNVFTDNDSLAALCARSFGAEVILLLTDVNGVYDRPPSEPNAKILKFYNPNSEENSAKVVIGEKSLQGRGGMGAKIDAAVNAVRPGSACQACIIAAGYEMDTIASVLGPYDGQSKGTLFLTPNSELHDFAVSEEKEAKMNKSLGGSKAAIDMATKARDEARKLQCLPIAERKAILLGVAAALSDVSIVAGIMEANDDDLAEANRLNLDGPLLKRLKLTPEKMSTLAAGITQIANSPDPLGVVKTKTELAAGKKDGLLLTQITVPIGVLLIIFESRPDSLPQIASLAIASGNGLLLKGGKEASRSNAAIHQAIGDAIEKSSKGEISRGLIGLISTRNEIVDLLKLEQHIDLVIPRGGNSLVSYIKANTKIPVLGHADGVCHVYVDEFADKAKAHKICVDSKVDYPSACNACESILFHVSALDNGIAMSTLKALRQAGVKCLGGSRSMKEGLCDTPADELKCEYGDLTVMVEVVDNLDEALKHIHLYGSGHTECIVTEKKANAEAFLSRIDAACAFHNASTRFADGYRFGLGAEVGISTGRIHARGPVGVEGLLTTKWVLRSEDCDVVTEFAKGEKVFSHKKFSLKN